MLKYKEKGKNARIISWHTFCNGYKKKHCIEKDGKNDEYKKICKSK